METQNLSYRLLFSLTTSVLLMMSSRHRGVKHWLNVTELVSVGSGIQSVSGAHTPDSLAHRPLTDTWRLRTGNEGAL